MANEQFDINSFSENSEESYNEHSRLVPIPKILVMNKVDLVSNRRRFNYLKQELEDIGNFDYTFNISAITGFGIEQLKEYVKEQAERGEWQYHPEINSIKTEYEKACEIMK